MLARRQRAAQPHLGVIDDIERDDDQRGYERDETDNLLAMLLPAADTRPPLPTRPPNPGRHDRAPEETGPARPHPHFTGLAGLAGLPGWVPLGGRPRARGRRAGRDGVAAARTAADTRPPLPTRPPNPGRHDRAPQVGRARPTCGWKQCPSCSGGGGEAGGACTGCGYPLGC
ncbi:hypothetical protein [Streptomyces triticirhizae]|nr:hypothetical protein [Streptomyces triticirhizae]